MSFSPFYRSWLFLVILGMWGSSLLGAWTLLWAYDTKDQNREHKAGQVPIWPKDSGIVPPTGKYTILMFVHPKCPCSLASLDELNAIMNNRAGSFGVGYVIFVPELGMDNSWSTGNYSWSKAGGIPHVTRLIDQNQKETHRFGAKISGFTLVFDPKGNCQFSGGITAERGHSGDNLGREIVQGLLESKPEAFHEHALFGCALPSFINLTQSSSGSHPSL